MDAPVENPPREVEPPAQFLCIITGDIMTDPVIGPDGYTYERAAITTEIGLRHRSPITKQPLTVGMLYPNRSLKDMIEEWQQRQEHNQQPAVTQQPVVTSNVAPTISTTSQTQPQSAIFFAPAQNVQSSQLPSHQELMQKLAETLGVEFSRVHVGSVVEQALVGMAGVYSDQGQASYRRQADGNTYFRLRLTEAECAQFVAFYRGRCIGFIIGEPQQVMAGDYKIVVSTALLHSQVSVQLGDFYKNSHQKLMERLATDLQVPHTDVYIGSVVEQTLAGLAGIQTNQSQASYRANMDFSTRFTMSFVDHGEFYRFTGYYNRHFPGFILRTFDFDPTTGKARVDVSTRLLMDTISLALGQHRVAQSRVAQQPH